jgi:hypothetical protein
MTTQFESYDEAVVRLATFQKKKGEPGTLLFATVTLLAHGRPRPVAMKTLDKIRIAGGTVYFRRVVMDARAAVSWYRTLGHGEHATPIPSREADIYPGVDGTVMHVSRLDDDPIWPNLGLPMGDGLFAQPSGRDHPAPFLGSLSSRVHRRFGSREGFEAFVADVHAVAFLARRLHLDLRSYPEYLGSVALAVPDPIIQRVENIMVPSNETNGYSEQILYRFVPRPGRSLDGLRLTTFDVQAHLLTGFESHVVPADGILVVDKGTCAGMYGYVVTHRDHGVLLYHPPTPFLRQVSFTMHADSMTGIRVDVPMGDAPDAPRMTYQGGKRSEPVSAQTLGEAPPHVSAIQRVNSASARRRQTGHASDAGQRWFSRGSREDAMRFLQKEIGNARSRVMIADPYFGGLQIGQFLYAAASTNVQFMVITSKLAFAANKRRTRAEAVIDFQDKLTHLEVNLDVSPKIFVVDASLLHDRFLVIDDVVWFLGSSLNSLGDKGSMIVKLPDPDGVIERLEELVGTALSFKAFTIKGASSEKLEG